MNNNKKSKQVKNICLKFVFLIILCLKYNKCKTLFKPDPKDILKGGGMFENYEIDENKDSIYYFKNKGWEFVYPL